MLRLRLRSIEVLELNRKPADPCFEGNQKAETGVSHHRSAFLFGTRSKALKRIPLPSKLFPSFLESLGGKRTCFFVINCPGSGPPIEKPLAAWLRWRMCQKSILDLV